MMRKKIAIVAGGDSSEHEVSLRSAAGIQSFLAGSPYEVETVVMEKWDLNKTDEENRRIRQAMLERLTEFDFCYITIHGTPGENGLLQGYLDMMHIPYSNPGVLASALTFNKYACTHYLQGFGIQISPSVILRKSKGAECFEILQTELEEVKKLGFPMFIKSNVGGSSYGCTKVKSEEEIIPAIERAFAEGDEVICEALMTGTEVTCGVYETRTAEGVKKVAFPVTEVVAHNEFFDYDAKYKGQVDEITPARIPDAVRDEIQATTLKIYEILGCHGIIRTDYFITDKGLMLMEVNTTPGMTATSFIPQQVRVAGLEIGQVLGEIIEN